MSESLRVRRYGRALTGVAALVAIAGLTLATASAQGSLSRAGSATNVYIVQLAGEPAVTYEGDIAGLPATKPAKGEKIDPESANVKRFVAHLNARHDAVLASVGGGHKLYDYDYVINGFAAQLTAAQVKQLEKNPEVVSIETAEEWYPDTSTTPSFLGLTGAGGLWEQLGGPSSGTNSSNATGAGEGIVVGIIDTGIWPEHPSVSDRVNGKLMYRPLPGNRWKGKCASAEIVTDGSWDANLCNNKLVGARFFLETREAVQGPVVAPDFRSPRDLNGHGSHTGTTAAGNHNITPTGSLAGFPPMSGMAPRARIAAYKVCWPSCFTPDSAAAFDQAVADGVDVLNFSISGSTSAVVGFVQNATRRAAEAGVFVAMSAGNSGPGDSTVAHVMPWVTTVAAGTHPRPANGVVTLGSGAVFNGVSLIKSTVGPAPVIRAQDAGLPTANPNLLRQCFSSQEPNTGGQPQLDPAKVAGKIVVCERGGAAPLNARVDKSAAVKEAGGVGTIIINTSANSLNGDVHTLPTVHLAHTDLAAVQTYAQTVGATATLSPGSTAPNAAPFVAAFSSRGPQAGAPALLKPDVIAPGVDILAGYSPASFELFNIISGTSMSSPHVAGLAALLKHRHPSWTPMMIKSALMTTGYDILGSFTDNATASSEARRAFAQGAGHVRPTLAADPGLVIEHVAADWPRYICGVGQASCSNPLHPTDLNGASVAIAAMPGAQTVARTVLSVSGNSQTYSASFSGLPGIDASSDPGMFTIAPGASQALNLSFTTNGAALNKYQAGHLTLIPAAGGNAVRIPIVIRPVAIAAPPSVTSDGSPVSWDVKTGYTGTLAASVAGLVPATTTPWTVAQDPDQTFNPADPTGTFSKNVVVPANSLFRAGIYEDAITPSGTDIDLYVYLGTSLVGVSADGDSNEEVTLRTGAGGVTLTVYVHGWSTNGPSATGTLFDWVATTTAGNTTLSGVGPAVTGATQTHTASFSGLTAGTRYLGEVRYSDGSSTIGRTILTVRTP
ncbi:MAG: S8 family peptidase [Gaiellaceae bacterium]